MCNSEETKENEIIERFYSKKDDRTAFHMIIAQMRKGFEKFEIPDGITNEDEMENWHKASLTCHALMVNYWTDLRKLWDKTWGLHFSNTDQVSLPLYQVWDDGYCRHATVAFDAPTPKKAKKLELCTMYGHSEESDGKYYFYVGFRYLNSNDDYVPLTPDSLESMRNELAACDDFSANQYYLEDEGLWIAQAYDDDKKYIDILANRCKKMAKFIMNKK